VEANTADAWVILYVKRLLSAPLQMADGSLAERDRGTPQGSAVSPVLANLFLHYAFDMWLARKFPLVPFERYVDDAVVQCRSEKQARMIRAALEERVGQVGLNVARRAGPAPPRTKETDMRVKNRHQHDQ
jgi:RNA-directed DNA polymerase